jgi:DNA-binding response OmpR family regulator
MKVLIVDDNKDITDLLSKFLKSKGFETVVTNDPFDGLDLIENEKFDSILLDMSMPEFSGIDIIDKLDREKLLQNQKIIIFSAISHSSNQINGFLKREGVYGCLKKPVELDKLLTAITS